MRTRNVIFVSILLLVAVGASGIYLAKRALHALATPVPLVIDFSKGYTPEAVGWPA